MEYFIAKILKSDYIGITPVKGYSSERMKSITSDIWLDWQEKLLKKKIVREHPIGKFYADGLIVEEKLVFEFFGCHYHGCIICKNVDRDTLRDYGKGTLKTYNNVYKETQKKLEYYKRRGFNIVQIWECEYADEKDNNESLKNYHRTRYMYYKKLRSMAML
jgi:G:T-mismatch repair DNA endonuclease (very short patch repair protein)